MSPNPTLTRLLVEAHAADLTERAQQARLARAVRQAGPHHGRVRRSTARLLVALAARLDDRLAPPTGPAPVSGLRGIG